MNVPSVNFFNNYNNTGFLQGAQKTAQSQNTFRGNVDLTKEVNLPVQQTQNFFEQQQINSIKGTNNLHGPSFRAGLDSQMLQTKNKLADVGLGGTNNPDNHKIFYAA